LTAPPRAVALGDHTPTRIGLGTNRLTDAPDDRSLLEAAVGAGLNFIDTAHVYTGGESESTIGRTLAPFPHELVIATKGGYGGGGNARLREELEQSFERLQAETIPLYYLHRVDPEVPIEETMGLLGEYREAGRIRYVGLSAVTVELIERARSVVPIAAVQNEYNLSERKYDDVVDYCTSEGIVFVPYFPLRPRGPSVLREIAARHGASRSQIKLAWLLHRSPLVAPIPGTLSLEHLKENLAALEIELSSDDLEALSASGSRT
jgi:pyridoxine 4-dehydrogenase